jgi:hypothetical protein
MMVSPGVAGTHVQPVLGNFVSFHSEISVLVIPRVARNLGFCRLRQKPGSLAALGMTIEKRAPGVLGPGL